MPTLREKLGRTVRHLRTNKGFSQEGFADACQLHRTYIGSVERGETNISLDNLERIAATLGLPLSRLFSETEKDR
jgi:transcriptional regulator with XRE-family HTH domain